MYMWDMRKMEILGFVRFHSVLVRIVRWKSECKQFDLNWIVFGPGNMHMNFTEHVIFNQDYLCPNKWYSTPFYSDTFTMANNSHLNSQWFPWIWITVFTIVLQSEEESEVKVKNYDIVQKQKTNASSVSFHRQKCWQPSPVKWPLVFPLLSVCAIDKGLHVLAVNHSVS